MLTISRLLISPIRRLSGSLSSTLILPDSQAKTSNDEGQREGQVILSCATKEKPVPVSLQFEGVALTPRQLVPYDRGARTE